MKILTILCMSLLAVSATAHESDFWLTDYSVALKSAKKSKKTVFMEFAGTDWCPASKAFKKNILDSKTFTSFAHSNFILLKIDLPEMQNYPDEKLKKKLKLAKKYKISAYPTVLILDSGGNVKVYSSYYPMSPQQYVENLKQKMKKAGLQVQ